MLKIVRNDIVKMECDAIVNTANEWPTYVDGVDRAVYEAAGADKLLAEREKIGYVKQGDAFITDAYDLPAKKIIHAVSPVFIDGKSGEEELLRSCYRKSLKLAEENGIKSIAFPLISTGSFGYPLEEGLRIAVEEINGFFGIYPDDDKAADDADGAADDMLIYIVVFGDEAADLSKKYTDDLESYIEQHYVEEKMHSEYDNDDLICFEEAEDTVFPEETHKEDILRNSGRSSAELRNPATIDFGMMSCQMAPLGNIKPSGNIKPTGNIKPPENSAKKSFSIWKKPDDNHNKTAKKEEKSGYEKLEEDLNRRLAHLQDSFSEYLMFLIEEKKMTPVEVYSRAYVTKKVFSKLKNDPNYHPSKEVALQLCVGAKLNLDETKDLLGRAGYALSPSSLMDVIFEFFIERGYYSIVEIDIQLEARGHKCLIDESKIKLDTVS